MSQAAPADTITSETSQPAPALFAREGHAFTTSRHVAAYFGKRHDNVLASIDKLILLEPKLRLLNFKETPYVDPQNGETYRSFDIARDGFALLAMGFTGSKALRWKLRYIEAFSAMELELRGPAQLESRAPPPLAPGLMMMMIGQRQIVVDANDYAIGAGDEGVVCDAAGKVTVHRGPLTPNTTSPWLGKRSVAGHWRKSKTPGIDRERGYFTVLGRLIQPGERRRRMIAA